MKISLLKSAALATLLAAPSFLASAQEAKEPAPSAEAAAEKPPKPAMDPDKQKLAAAKKLAMEDPEVKAAMDLAKKARTDADKLMYDKIRATDPSLAELVDKEEAKMKPKEPKEPKEPKPAKKPAKAEDPAATPAATPAN